MLGFRNLDVTHFWEVGSAACKLKGEIEIIGQYYFFRLLNLFRNTGVGYSIADEHILLLTMLANSISTDLSLFILIKLVRRDERLCKKTKMFTITRLMPSNA